MIYYRRMQRNVFNVARSKETYIVGWKDGKKKAGKQYKHWKN